MQEALAVLIAFENRKKEEVKSEVEDNGIGCNECYACVSGGSGPCVKEKEKKEKND